MQKIKSHIMSVLKYRYLRKIVAFVLILTLINIGWVSNKAYASEPVLVTFSGRVIDDGGMPASTTIKAYLVEKDTGTVHDVPFAEATSRVDTGEYVLRDTSAYGSPEIIDISGYINKFDFVYKVKNVGVTGGVSEYRAYFTSGSNIARDFQITTHGTVNVHITDMNGNNAPGGVPMWFSYVGPYGNNDTNWPDNAPPSDGVSPKQTTDGSGIISMRLNASWTFDGGSLGGFIYSFPAGYRNYGGALQNSTLRYDWTERADVSAHAGKIQDYTIKVRPLGQIMTRIEDSITGAVISGANISYTSADPNDESNKHNINKYNEGNSVYALGPVTIHVNDPDNPGSNHLGHGSAELTASPIPWDQVSVTFKLDPHKPGAIAGKVYDTDERPVSGATVELLWDEWGGEGGLEGGLYSTIMQTTTGADGSYLLTGVVPTSYRGYVLRANKTLYRTALQGNVYVTSDITTAAESLFLSNTFSTVNITPSVFSIGQSAVVTAQVKDAKGNTAADGTEVSLSTSRGVLTSGDNTGERINVLVSDGTASARLSSDTEGPGTVILNNGEAASSFEVTSAADSIAPTWPEGSNITASNAADTSVTLSWTAAADNKEVTNYKILKDGVLYKSVGNILTAAVMDLSAGTEYTFKVEASDAAGNWSSTGPSIKVLTKVSSPSNDSGDGSDSSVYYVQDQYIFDNPDNMTVDLSKGSTILSAAQMNSLIANNKTKPVMLNGENYTITFEKGTMASSRQTDYDFGLWFNNETNYSRIKGLSGKSFTLLLSFNHSGSLPAEAVIRVKVGAQYAGKILYYYYCNPAGLFEYIQSTFVDKEGYALVRQNHCSNYVFLSEPLPNIEPVLGVKRISGLSRVDTALNIAKTNYPGNISNAVLAAASDYPDALAGSVLAYKLKAPLLLVGDTSQDHEKIVSYLKSNMDAAGTIYILGGIGAVSSGAENMITSAGFKNINRISGSDRYETSKKIADSLDVKTGTPIILVSGENYQDALSISSMASVIQNPILLVQKDCISDAVKEKIAHIKPARIYIIGLEGAVSRAVEEKAAEIASLDKTSVIRIGGIDRYETSLKVAQYFNPTGSTICVATGKDFPDALSGSIYSANSNAPILLVDESLPAEIVNDLKTRRITGVIIFGGEGTVNKRIEEALLQLIVK